LSQRRQFPPGRFVQRSYKLVDLLTIRKYGNYHDYAGDYFTIEKVSQEGRQKENTS